MDIGKMDPKILYAAGLAIVFIAVLGIGFIINPPKPQNVTIEITNLTFSVGPGSNPVLGNPNASIYLVEFTDYQCPFCERHATETFPQIEANFVETGKVAYYLRDFPIHSNSRNAATAARCAGEQSKYWDMHSLLFARQSEWSGLSSADLAAKFVQYASSFGINTDQFSACYASGKYDAAISADQQDGISYGIDGTPSSVIVLQKTASEQKILAVLNGSRDYVQQGILSAGRDLEGRYVFFIKARPSAGRARTCRS